MARTPLRVAHFVQRYPPALGGSEAYFAPPGNYLVAAGDAVTVFTTNALDLEAFWRLPCPDGAAEYRAGKRRRRCAAIRSGVFRAAAISLPD